MRGLLKIRHRKECEQLKFDASKVKPKHSGLSDKYSWNIYRVIRLLEIGGKRAPLMDYKILYYEKSQLDGSIVKFNPCESLHPGHCFITKVYPMNQGTASRRISEILAMSPNSNIDFYCYDSSLDHNHLVDITDCFWEEYVQSGRCVFDREHNGWWRGDETRFTQINRNSRRCNWCGQHQKKTIKKSITIKRNEVWSA